jgi:hypothetical protein
MAMDDGGMTMSSKAGVGELGNITAVEYIKRNH